MHRFSGIDPTGSGPTGPTVSQLGGMDPNREKAAFSDIFGTSDIFEGAVSLSETMGPDIYVTRRSNASDRKTGSLGQAMNAELRNHNSALLRPGLVSTIPEPEFARVSYLDMKRVGSPGPGLRRRLLYPGGEALVFDPGGSR